LLLRALPKLHQPFELLIVGDGEAEEKAKLMAMAEETHVAQHIHWLGFHLHDRLKLELWDILAAVLRIAPLNFLASNCRTFAEAFLFRRLTVVL